ncbi:type II secretion system F family protein, partial [Candidatus Saccharibacteria bacterium]|nr:type II secretion system F family protein [Candidatus Saccharibacteria bacterium]
MRKFNYEAKDSATSKVVKATVSADSERAAAKLLIAQGYSPLKIEEAQENGSFLDKITNRITTKDKLVFTRQLATLIGAGLPLSQSLRTVLDQTQNKRMKAIVQDIIESIEGGHTLHESFARHPEVFDKLYLALVSVGEASGTLDEALQRVAAQQEKDAATTSKIRGAMTYPVIVLFVIVAVLGFMLLTVVPQVEKLYDDLNQQLPLITGVMVAGSAFIIKFWYIIIIALAVAVYFFIQYIKTDNGIRMMDTVKLNVPLFKGLYRRLYIARFTRTSETLLQTGVAMLDMLKISSEAVNNVIISEGIDKAAEKVKGGKALSIALQPEDYIPDLVPQMIKIGEQSGQIAEMMGKTAKVYEDELDEQIRTISTSIEPILMVVLAVAAGGMVAAILLP